MNQSSLETWTLFPQTLTPIFVTLMLSFLIGLEREESLSGRRYKFGGIRTFPIIGLCGYLTARLTENQPFAMGVGILVIGALMWLSYRKKLQLSDSGVTSELSGLFTFLLGALVQQDALWEATALTVIVLFLLELKVGLESLARKIPAEEIFTFTRFLLMSAVILPIVPNREVTSLHLNPFQIWLVVVVISGLSYAVYLIERIFNKRSSVLMAAILGGLYSSTSTTVVLAKQSRDDDSSGALLSGGILMASGFMYFRLVILLSLFNGNLGYRLLWPFLGWGGALCLMGTMSMQRKGERLRRAVTIKKKHSKNPLELSYALFFAAVFSGVSALTTLAIEYLGVVGIYGLAFLAGLVDVDPFVMSLTQSVKSVVHLEPAAAGVIIAAASNNIMKGVYAALLGTPVVRKRASLPLILIALLSLTTLWW